MTAEEFVNQHYPYAYVEGYTSGRIKGMSSRYYLVWSSRKRDEKFRLAEGNTKSNAWANAKKNIKSNLASKQLK